MNDDIDSNKFAKDFALIYYNIQQNKIFKSGRVSSHKFYAYEDMKAFFKIRKECFTVDTRPFKQFNASEENHEIIFDIPGKI